MSCVCVLFCATLLVILSGWLTTKRRKSRKEELLELELAMEREYEAGKRQQNGGRVDAHKRLKRGEGAWEWGSGRERASGERGGRRSGEAEVEGEVIDGEEEELEEEREWQASGERGEMQQFGGDTVGAEAGGGHRLRGWETRSETGGARGGDREMERAREGERERETERQREREQEHEQEREWAREVERERQREWQTQWRQQQEQEEQEEQQRRQRRRHSRRGGRAEAFGLEEDDFIDQVRRCWCWRGDFRVD
ncbi:unnamed protein product [Closterium sp. NIES-54]